MTTLFVHIYILQSTYRENELRGCLDQLIKAQKEEIDGNGDPILDDGCLVGIILDLYAAGENYLVKDVHMHDAGMVDVHI